MKGERRRWSWMVLMGENGKYCQEMEGKFEKIKGNVSERESAWEEWCADMEGLW